MRLVLWNHLTLFSPRDEEWKKMDVVFLTGTQLKMMDKDHFVTKKNLSFHAIFSSDWSKTQYSSKSAGIRNLINRKYKATQIVRIHRPPDILQGRIGALRLRTSSMDFLLATFYLPPASASEAEQMQTTSLTLQWLEQVLPQTATRTFNI